MRQKVRQDGVGLALGAAARAPTAWPAGVASLPRDAGRATLVMVVHPHCPCARGA